MALVKAFLKAGIMTELGEKQDTPTGTPQGGSATALPPCGVPADESRSPVSVLKIPALRNALINATTRRSEIRRRTRSSSALWLISSKQAAMSPSNAHS